VGLIVRWLLAAIALFVTVKIGRAIGLNMDVALGAAPFIAVVVLAIVNALIRPILVLLTLPLNLLTFGLVGVLINALMFWLASRLVTGFEVHGFLAALFGSVVMGIASAALNQITSRGK